MAAAAARKPHSGYVQLATSASAVVCAGAAVAAGADRRLGVGQCRAAVAGIVRGAERGRV